MGHESKIKLFTYGGLMTPQILEGHFDPLPHSYEYKLCGWQRIWNATIPPGFFKDGHVYAPKLAEERGLYLSYLNIVPSEDQFSVGRLYEIPEKDIPWFDEFEGGSLGLMKRVEIQPSEKIFAYVASDAVLENFKYAESQNKIVISQFYQDMLLDAAKDLTMPLHKNDILACKPQYPLI